MVPTVALAFQFLAVVRRFEAVRFALGLFFAVERLVDAARLAVVRLAVVRLAVVRRLAVERVRLAAGRLAVARRLVRLVVEALRAVVRREALCVRDLLVVFLRLVVDRRLEALEDVGMILNSWKRGRRDGNDPFGVL